MHRVSILPHLSTADHMISISLFSIRVGGRDRSAGWRGELEATRCCAHMQEAALLQRSVGSRHGDLWYQPTTPVSCLETKSCTHSRSSNNRYPRIYHQFFTFPVDGRYSNGSSANGGIPDSRRYVVGRHRTVLAAIWFVVYPEAETRAAMDAGHPQTEVELVDLEINILTKVRQKPFGGLEADLVCLLDSVHGYVRPIARTRCPQWFPRSGTYTSSGGTRSAVTHFRTNPSLKCWFVLFPSLHFTCAIHSVSWIIAFISCVYSILEFNNLNIVARTP